MTFTGSATGETPLAEKTTPRTWDDVQTVSHTKKAVPEGLWMKCPSCAETVFRKAVESNLRVCPKCDHHLRVGGPERVEQMLDPGTFERPAGIGPGRGFGRHGDQAFRPDLRFPLPANFAENITGKRVISVDRRAKYLLIRLEGGLVMLSHLGMSGRYRIYNDTPPALEPHDHLELVTDKGVVIRYNDPRRFGILDLFAEDQVATHKLLASLGPEPLSNAFDGKTLAENLGEKRSAIKVAILDQRVVSGVGNIYASEILFDAKISPFRKGSSLKKYHIDTIVKSTRKILRRAIKHGGSSINDYVSPDGTLGNFQNSFKVYGKEGHRINGFVIKKEVLYGRSTFFCPKIQK